MGTCFLYGNGGGSDLNFKVLGGTSQPENPKENTIWVNTDMEITGWSFTSAEPETTAEGLVWVKTGFGSSAPFNALKKNEVQVCPFSTKQYVDGAWADKTAMIYASGVWSLFHPVSEYLVKSGVIDMTAHPHTATDGKDAFNAVQYDPKPALALYGSNGGDVTHTFSKVTIPGYATKMRVEIYKIPSFEGTSPSVRIGGVYKSINAGGDNFVTDITVTMDVSAIAGTTVNFSVTFRGLAYHDICYIGNAWFE